MREFFKCHVPGCSGGNRHRLRVKDKGSVGVCSDHYWPVRRGKVAVRSHAEMLADHPQMHLDMGMAAARQGVQDDIYEAERAEYNRDGGYR